MAPSSGLESHGKRGHPPRPGNSCFSLDNDLHGDRQTSTEFDCSGGGSEQEVAAYKAEEDVGGPGGERGGKVVDIAQCAE